MTFTTEEENILKLVARKLKAKIQLDRANHTMGVEIRTAFASIDAEKRLAHKATIDPLMQESRDTDTAVQELIE